MIITRTPFRISFAGGGSDLPSYYHKEAGAVLSTTIDKYMYIAIHPHFEKNKIQLKYSKTELVERIEDIQHPIFREVLKVYQLKGVDINSIADIPAGTGMGSSSSFTVGLLNAVRAYLGKYSSGTKLSELACEIEMDKVGSPIGKQDQYAAGCGGMNLISFYPDETVNVEKVIMQPLVRKQLDENLLMMYIGGTHSANEILKKQQAALGETEKFHIQREMVQLALSLRETLQNNEIDDFGRVLHEGWLLKKSLVKNISNLYIDEVYQRGIDAGALGGKLLGAGAAGFILFYCPKEQQKHFREKMSELTELNFHFENNGSQVIYIGDKYIDC